MAVHGDREPKIKFIKLQTLLDNQGRKWQYLRDSGISPGIVNKMKTGKGDVSTATIERVCELLNCQPGDIMEYVPTEDKE
ncbi:helix-turn-helix transcriptional regulator [uncultured Robinsoniella sp.]|uniref:helix-turn-helix domain-containing protein n=1 Tax=uncultured Robinsoniella sp. TaxID=904190 RepID=UPI00206D3B47|nr:MAG TPA: Cro/C1-type HTH DNA-binding domain protein [Caudoviricetes sp.]